MMLSIYQEIHTDTVTIYYAFTTILYINSHHTHIAT